MADRVDVERNLLTSVNSEGSFLIRRSSAGSHIGFVLSGTITAILPKEILVIVNWNYYML